VTAVRGLFCKLHTLVQVQWSKYGERDDGLTTSRSMAASIDVLADTLRTARLGRSPSNSIAGCLLRSLLPRSHLVQYLFCET
jgi:hypothetical protein